MKKNYLVFWSGGLDSTYLVYKLLNEGHHVSSAYIEISNNANKVKREKSAIQQILNSYTFQNLKQNHIHWGESLTINLTMHAGNNTIIALVYIPIFLTAYTFLSSKEIDYCAIGYVLNDCAISYIPDIKNVAEALNGLAIEDSKFPPLVFPLIKKSKQEIYNELPWDVKQYTTCCENKLEQDDCGECIPCKRLIMDGLFNNRSTPTTITYKCDNENWQLP